MDSEQLYDIAFELGMDESQMTWETVGEARDELRIIFLRMFMDDVFTYLNRVYGEDIDAMDRVLFPHFKIDSNY